MKSLITLSSKYWVIFPWSFCVSFVLFLLVPMIANPWRDVVLDHVFVKVTDVQPTCVDVIALDQQPNSFEVNITCPELLQNPNRKSMEEAIAENISEKDYEFVFGGKAYLSEDGLQIKWLKSYAYRVYRVLIPNFSKSWRMEKKIDDTLITLSGTVQTDMVYRLIAITKSIMAWSLLGLLTMSFLYLPKMIRNYFKKT